MCTCKIFFGFLQGKCSSTSSKEDVGFGEKKMQQILDKGLISADRSDKATLLLTIPRSLFKSSAKDLALENLDFDRFSA